jgi:DNA-binding transcriptional LysR family regulator
VKLLDRCRSSVIPTEAGLRLFETGRTMLHLGNSIRAELKSFTAPKLLRVGVLQSLSSRQISKLLASFRRTNQHVAIELFDGVSSHLFKLLAEQRLDIILTILNGESSKFESRVLFEEPYVLAVPSKHRFAARQSVSLADLDDEPFIVRTGCDKFQEACLALDTRAVKLRVVYRTDQDDRAFALVAAGIGVAFTPAHFDVPGVKQVPVSDLGLVRTIGLMWSPEREDEDLGEFVRFAETHSWTSRPD